MKCSSASLIVPLRPSSSRSLNSPRVIEPVLVADQRAGQRADLQQPVPVGVVAGQPGDLQAEHDPGPAHADLGDQALEPFPVGGRRAGLALVDVDDDDLVGGPAQRDRPLPQRVLAGGGLGVVAAPAAAWTGAHTGRRCGPGARRSTFDAPRRSPRLTPARPGRPAPSRPAPRRAGRRCRAPARAAGRAAGPGRGGQVVAMRAARPRPRGAAARPAPAASRPPPRRAPARAAAHTGRRHRAGRRGAHRCSPCPAALFGAAQGRSDRKPPSRSCTARRAVYQAATRSAGVKAASTLRGGCSGAGDSDQRDRVGGDPVPVALEGYEVVVVELCGLQPLDRAEEQQLPGDRFPVSADDVDLDVVAARPVAADRRAAGCPGRAAGARAPRGLAARRRGRASQVQLRSMRASVRSERIRSTSARCGPRNASQNRR